MRHIVFAVMILLAMAASPTFAQKFASDALFDGRYNNNPATSVSIFRNPPTVFKKIEVEGNSRILSEMEKVARKDAEKCQSTSEFYEKGEYRLLMSFGATTICFERESKDSGSLWISIANGSSANGRSSSSTRTVITTDNSSSVSKSEWKKTARRAKNKKRTAPRVIINGEPIAQSICTSVTAIVEDALEQVREDLNDY